MKFCRKKNAKRTVVVIAEGGEQQHDFSLNLNRNNMDCDDNDIVAFDGFYDEVDEGINGCTEETSPWASTEFNNHQQQYHDRLDPVPAATAATTSSSSTVEFC